MKKFILIAVGLLTIATASAQSTNKLTNGSGYMKSTPTHATTDTITNAVTKYQYVQIDGYNDIVTIQPTFTKISGTAAATVKMQGSLDNLAFSDIGNAYTVTDVATQTTTFSVNPSTYIYYRMQIVPTGTQSVKVKTPVIARKK